MECTHERSPNVTKGVATFHEDAPESTVILSCRRPRDQGESLFSMRRERGVMKRVFRWRAQDDDEQRVGPAGDGTAEHEPPADLPIVPEVPATAPSATERLDSHADPRSARAKGDHEEGDHHGVSTELEQGEGPAENVESDLTAPSRRPRKTQSVLGAALAVLVAGLTSGSVWGDDVIEGLFGGADARSVDRYMARVSTEWARVDGVISDVSTVKRPYDCSPAQHRVQPLGAELNAIGAPDEELGRDVDVYVRHLSSALQRCATGRLSGQEVAALLFAAQVEWQAARMRALELGWDGPCAREATRTACLGAQ